MAAAFADIVGQRIPLQHVRSTCSWIVTLNKVFTHSVLYALHENVCLEIERQAAQLLLLKR